MYIHFIHLREVTIKMGEESTKKDHRITCSNFKHPLVSRNIIGTLYDMIFIGVFPLEPMDSYTPIISKEKNISVYSIEKFL